MISIGMHYLQKNHTASDFFLGGRKMNPYFAALSAEASDMSSWLLMALPGLTFVSGLKEAFWIAVGLVLGTYVNWLLVAKALRKCSTFYGNAITIPEFLARRFNDKSKLITIISSFFILVFFTIYTASGFVACAKLLAMVFDTSYTEALMIGIIIILSYSLLGGYWAICATDFVQNLLIIVVLIVTLALLVLGLGSVDEQNLSYMNNSFVNPFNKDAQFGLIQMISAVGWGLGYFGMPHILVRFMSIKDEAQIPLARRIATIWIVFALVCAVLLGILAKAYLGVDYNENNGDLVLINIFLMIFPAFIAGIFLCAVLAAAMSTADSQLLVATSAFSLDFVQNVLNKKMSNEKLLLLSRVTIIAIAIIAFL